MAIRAKATVLLKFNSKKQLTALLDALMPEACAPVTRRANVKLEKDGLFLLLTVEADDTVALRSTLNAYLRWINSAVNVIDVVEHT
ncbi:MAG: KEOPS complex subunit Pcc1 [Candidatus Bathyarchaeia archaeon]|jgi:tRNA threonylcarbamoyladenosine modification (KEOPS) complex  Pcc1 subunit